VLQFDKSFDEVAPNVASYHIRSSWLAISKFYNEIAKKYDTTLAMAFVLLAIDNDKGVPVTKIAPRIGMEPNSLSRLINTMESNGTIIRSNDPEDQRKVYIQLTDKGKQLRHIAIKEVFQLEKVITHNLEDSQREAFFDVLAQIPKSIQDFKKKVRKI
jgi:DNA-binding MarR family transcriptional regulator